MVEKSDWEMEGWVRLLPFDKAKRRSLWVRLNNNVIEFRAGREGDDSFIYIPLDGTQLAEGQIYVFKDLIETAVYSQEIDDG